MTTTNPKTLPLPPGNFGLPIIGETIGFIRDSDFTDKRYKKYGSIFKTRIFGNPTVVMIGSEANRFLFTNDNKYFSGQWPRSTKILLGPGSLSIQMGSTHQKRRKILSQAFQPRALKEYTSTMEEILQNYCDKAPYSDDLLPKPAPQYLQLGYKALQLLHTFLDCPRVKLNCSNCLLCRDD